MPQSLFAFIIFSFVVSLFLVSGIEAYATPDLEVLPSYINPVEEIGAFGPTIANSGNSTAYNIKFTFIDVNDAYTYVQDPPLSDTLDAGETMSTKYTLTPKKLGLAEIQYLLTWEDEDGKKYSVDNKNEPITLQNSKLPAKAPGFTDFQIAWFILVIVIVLGYIGYYLIKKKKSIPNQ